MTKEQTTKAPERPAAAVPMYFASKARDIAEFCVAKGDKCFAEWPIPTIFAYVFFHLIDGGCFVVRKNGGIAGVMFLWGANEADIRQRAAVSDSPFYWQRSKRDGDSLFLAEVVAAHSSLPKLFKLAAARWPDWQRKKVFTYREGKLIEFPHDVIKRMILGTN